MSFCWEARVYWEDTDGGGVVYYANYLKFLERARTEWLRAQGVSQLALAEERGIVFTVTSVEIHYRRPARLDDVLVVTCEPARAGGASLSFAQRIYRRAASGIGPEAGELLAMATVCVACVDARTMRPQRLPDFVVDVLTA
ncbi:MAG: tol-pal system-associated acyl-CoA thioesterase [Steroidobacteraceae bacterium]